MLLNDGRYFYHQAKHFEHKDHGKSEAYLRASVIMAFAALEALANTLCFGLAESGNLALHEEAFAKEMRVEFQPDGSFNINGRMYHSLEDKIKFLHRKTKGCQIEKGNVAWQRFVEAKRLRNKVVHHKPGQTSRSFISIREAKVCLIAVMKVAKMLENN